MKVLLLHNSYQQAGGEDSVFFNELKLLRSNGFNVLVFLVSNLSIKGFFGRFFAALGTVFSVSSYFRVRRQIREFGPDIVHVHNFFPLFSPSVFFACRHERVPCVLTLHNFRIICPTSMFLHNGVVTLRSLLEGPWWAVRERVYKNSIFASFLLALMIDFHKRVGTWSRVVDVFIVLSQFSRIKFIEFGIPKERIFLKPNFIDAPSSFISEVRTGFLFVGRVSSEKGVEVLDRAARQLALDEGFIRIIGRGPQERIFFDSKIFLCVGKVENAVVRGEMNRALALVLPSIWFEGFPMVLVEAFAAGLPVIASRIGALEELVDDGVTGLLFSPGSSVDLAEKLDWARSNPDAMMAMGCAARREFEKKYSASINFDSLRSIYFSAIKNYHR